MANKRKAKSGIKNQTEDAPREGDERFRLFFENGPEYCYMISPEGTMLDVNRAALDALGYEKTELVGEHLRMLYAPESQSRMKQLFAKWQETGRLKDEEMTIVTKSGEKRTVLLSADVVRDKDGEIVHSVSFQRDITERKRAENQLREAKERAEAYLNIVGVMLAAVNADEAISLINARGCEILGYQPEELMGRNWFDLLVPESIRDEVRSIFRKLMAGDVKPVEYYENPLVTKDGDERLMAFHNIITRDATGRITGVLFSAEDITERNRAQEVLRESEERYRLLLKASDAAIAFVSKEGIILIMNDRAAEMWGKKPEELVGKHLRELGLPDESMNLFQKVIETGEGIQQEFSSARPSRHFIENMQPVRDNTGQIVGVQLLAHDITERKQLEEELRHAEKMEAIGELAGGIAHDFNNRVAGILGFAELLAAELEDEQLKDYAEQIVKASTSVAGLTAQLLAFARKGDYLSVPVDIHKVIANAVALLKHSIDKRIKIKQNLHANSLTTTGDPTQLENVILNIALNARDAMPEGGDLIFSTAVVTHDEDYCRRLADEHTPGQYVQMSVTDTGVGMDEETRKHIFEPFFTTKKAGKGTGMGLAAVYGIVKIHHGAVNVYSEQGHGTTVNVYLPLAEAEVGAGEAVTAVEPVQGTARILVVDDEEMVLDMVSQMLRRLGYKVMTFKDGAEAVEYYRKSWKHVDLVLLDMVTPDPSGRNTFTAMHEINPNIKALLLSGYSLTSEAQEILDEGVLGFVQKPFTQAELLQKIADGLRGGRG